MPQAPFSPAPARMFGVTALAHAALLSAGFLVLAEAFAFPDILRESPQTRLALFQANAATVFPAYYAMALTGLTQIALALSLNAAFRKAGSLLLSAALVFGILAGVFQILGFIRWPIVIPWLAQEMAAASGDSQRQAMVALMEGTLNRYAGMAVGEHLGFLAQGLWSMLAGLALIRTRLASPLLGLSGIVLGLLLIGGALEQLGGPFTVLGMFSAPASAAWLGWLLMLALSLVRTREDGKGPAMGPFSLLLYAALMAAFVMPALG